jgi:hypothetical protein
MAGEPDHEVSPKPISLFKPTSASEERFDQLTLAVAANQLSRGQVLKALGAALLLSGPLSALWSAPASAQPTCTPNDNCGTVCGTYIDPQQGQSNCVCALSRGNLATVSCVQQWGYGPCSSDEICRTWSQQYPELNIAERCFVCPETPNRGLCVHYC